MLCPMTDNGDIEITRDDFDKECVKIQNSGACLICNEGKAVRLGGHVNPPEGVTFITAAAKKEPAANIGASNKEPFKTTKNDGYPGDDRLKPIPYDVLQGITVSGLKSYWRNEKLPQTCRNCARSPIQLPAKDCCWLCYDAGRGRQGMELVESLADASKRASAVKLRKKNSPKKKKQTPVPVAEKKTAATKPRLGVMPKIIWKQQRLGELHSGIGEHIKAGRLSEPCIAEWCQEMQELLQELAAQ